MLTRRAFAQLAALVVAGNARSGPIAAPDARAAEVLALRKFVEHTSPRGLEAASNPEWRRDWEAYQQRAGTMGDGPYVIGLRRLLAWFREGHTTIVPFEFLGSAPAPLGGGVWGHHYPLKAQAFHDGLCITETSPDARALLGSRLHAIGGRPVEEVMVEHAKAWPAENPAWAHNWAGLLASSVGTLHGLGVARGPVGAALQFDALLADGSATTASLMPQPGAGAARNKLERARGLIEQQRAERTAGNFSMPVGGGRALYVSIDDMADLDSLSFAQFTDNILASLKSTQLQRVIVDLRRNGGGDNYLCEPLRHELGRSRFNRPGGLCVLIGPATFSAAQNFANRLERECFVTFIGEPTGSAPNLVGDAAYFVGKATGITAMVATRRWFDGGPDDQRRWIAPDIPVPSLFADWVAGRDPALEAAIAAPFTDSETFAARVRYFERTSQRSRWRPFWNPA